jgi:hypothetical protein
VTQRDVPDWAKRYLGRLGYALTGLAAIASQSPFEATLTLDGVPHALIAHQIVIASGRFHAGRPIVAHASADDRQFVVEVVVARARWRLLRALVAYFARLDDRLPDREPPATLPAHSPRWAFARARSPTPTPSFTRPASPTRTVMRCRSHA